MAGARRLSVHGTAVALGAWAALLRGASGAGKSDLALRFLSEGGELPPHEAVPESFSGPALVGDDRVHLTQEADQIIVTGRTETAGWLEVRGCGIVAVPYRLRAVLCVLIDLDSSTPIPRYPDPVETENIFGISLPRLRLDPFTASAAQKLRLLLKAAGKIPLAPYQPKGQSCEHPQDEKGNTKNTPGRATDGLSKRHLL